MEINKFKKAEKANLFVVFALKIKLRFDNQFLLIGDVQVLNALNFNSCMHFFSCLRRKFRNDLVN